MFNYLIIFGAKYLILIVIFLAGIFFIFKKKEIKKRIAIFGIVILPATYALGKLVSLFYYNPCPFVEENFQPLIPHSPDNGFPSDHVLICAGISSLIFIFNKKLSILLWIMTLIIGFCRIYAGVHHLIDILASIFIAIFVLIIVNYILNPIVKKL